jgi:penicillin-binding protein 2
MRNPFEIYTSSSPSSNKRPLDWEESALDTQTYIEGVFDAERSAPKVKWLGAVLILSFLIMGGRIFYLQVINGQKFRVLSENNRIRSQTLLAPRGLIRDRNGEILVQNTASFNLVAVPFDLPKEGLDEQLAKLAKDFELDTKELQDKILGLSRKSIEPVLIKQDISQDQSILFETKATEFLGFSIQKIPVRDYINPIIFSHVLGYTGLVGPEESQKLDQDRYDSVDFIGKSGIELEYENFFHGQNGENLVEVDATGKLLNILGENSPVPGQAAVLNIDKGLQEKLYEQLNSKRGSIRAAAVAINPKNGQVLALLSLPGFDNNMFAHGIKKDQYATLLGDKSLPLFNRAIAGTYPPGSTVKPMVASAALEERIIDSNTIIYDNGVLVIPNQYNSSISYNFYGWKRSGLGPMDVKSAIAESSDIYFYTIAGGHPNSTINGMGAEKLAEYYRKYNLGKNTGIDIQGEKPGLVADPEWKASYFKNDAVLKKWYLGDTYHIAIGQGDMLATPLQVAEWTAIIANGGKGFKPQILNKIVNSKGDSVFENKPEVLVNKFISDKNLKLVQEGMRQNVLAGSGRQLSALPISSAGKTGTSQFDGSDPSRTHAWFTAYAPYEDPEIVITILVEAGGEGHAAAVPVVKETLEWWAKNRYGR